MSFASTPNTNSAKASVGVLLFTSSHTLLITMIRIAGVNLPDQKKIIIALTAIHGIGRTRAAAIVAAVGIDASLRAKEIPEDQATRLREEIEKKYRVEGELKHEVKMNVKRLREIKCYRGRRHIAGLPSRGQRTKTNSRTVRGNKRVTMGSGRRTVSKT